MSTHLSNRLSGFFAAIILAQLVESSLAAQLSPSPWDMHALTNAPKWQEVERPKKSLPTAYGYEFSVGRLFRDKVHAQ